MAIGDPATVAAAEAFANVGRHDPAGDDHMLVERLMTLHPPASPEVAELMDELRAQFINLAHQVVDTVPRTPDRAVAIRSIHRALMDTIASVACNQEAVT